MNRRDSLRLGATAGLGAFGVVFYTFEVEPHWVTVVERDLPVTGLPQGLAGARLVQVSDFHVGPKVSDAEIPSGAPDHVVRTVTENSPTLKFTSQGFEVE